MTSRRHFIQSIPVVGVALCAANPVFADAPHVDEKDPQAVGMGYVTDAARVDKAKFSKYSPGQDCGNCQFFQGKAGDASAPCTIFGGKQVEAKGWCNIYSKKA